MSAAMEHTHEEHAGTQHGGPAQVVAPGQPVYYVPEPNRFTRLLMRMYARAPTWTAPVAIATCFAGAASWVLVSNPTSAGAGDVSTCLVRLTTGLDCPGCGGTRAFYYLLQGNIPEAARHHAVAVFAAPFLVWLYLAWSVKRIWGKEIPRPRIGARAVAIFVAAWAVFMVVRNLPFAPFTSLYV